MMKKFMKVQQEQQQEGLDFKKVEKETVKKQCEEYEKRRNALCRGLTKIGWKVPDSKGTMFAWAPIPEKFTNSNDFCMELMEKTGVICTPGSAFGSLGEGYVRFALVHPEEVIKEAVEKINNWFSVLKNVVDNALA